MISLALEMSLLSFLASLPSDRLPCGLDCTDQERDKIAALIDDLVVNDPANKVVLQRGQVKDQDILGEWNLLYTSSRTMMINKSLSGLGRSESELAKVSSIRHKLTGSKYVHFI